jgi:hypothetical protein
MHDHGTHTHMCQLTAAFPWADTDYVVLQHMKRPAGHMHASQLQHSLNPCHMIWQPTATPYGNELITLQTQEATVQLLCCRRRQTAAYSNCTPLGE